MGSTRTARAGAAGGAGVAEKKSGPGLAMDVGWGRRDIEILITRRAVGQGRSGGEKSAEGGSNGPVDPCLQSGRPVPSLPHPILSLTLCHQF